MADNESDDLALAKLQLTFTADVRRWVREETNQLLVDAIEKWMADDGGQMQYLHGNAQGIARTLAKLHHTSFVDEWERGLDNYQRSITQPEKGFRDD